MMHSEPSPSLSQMNTWPAGGNPGLPTHPVFALISGSFLLKSVDAAPTKEGSQEAPHTLPGHPYTCLVSAPSQEAGGTWEQDPEP